MLSLERVRPDILKSERRIEMNTENPKAESVPQVLCLILTNNIPRIIFSLHSDLQELADFDSALYAVIRICNSFCPIFRSRLNNLGVVVGASCGGHI